MNIIRPSVFPPGVVSGVSTRRGGFSPAPLGMNLSYRVGDAPENVLKNRSAFFGELGIPLDRLAAPGQVHGTTVRNVNAPGKYPETDGLITSATGLFLCLSVADCVPVLFHDPVCNVVGAVHAGWRGTASGIVTTAIRIMKEEFGTSPRNLLAYLGPSAGECCYSVGPDLESRFPASCVSHRDGKIFVDLRKANLLAMLEAGLVEERVESSTWCTISDSTLFHSFRRDGAQSGRMLGVIGRIA